MTTPKNDRTAEGTPALSIVIVNSDGMDDTLRCLESIYAHPPRTQCEVILVDNCSAQPIQPLVLDRFSDVHFFSAPTRQGFARNCNIGIRNAHGDYVMILNNDTLVHSDALDRLLAAFKDHPQYGMAGPRLVSSKGRVQSVCARALHTPFSYVIRLLLLDLGLPTGRAHESWLAGRIARRASGPVPCINGACMLVSRAVLQRVGMLDEGFDFYFEDMEWCHRVQRAGWQVGYVADAHVTHLGDRSLSTVKEWAKKSEYRSALRYFRRYHSLSGWQAQLLWLATVTAFLLRTCAFAVLGLTHRDGHARAYWNLFRWSLTQNPAAITERNV